MYDKLNTIVIIFIGFTFRFVVLVTLFLVFKSRTRFVYDIVLPINAENCQQNNIAGPVHQKILTR
jgi:hypothetical protein